MTAQETVTVETYLPIFSGFYNTIFDLDSDEEQNIEYFLNEVEEFKQYDRQDMENAFCNVIDYREAYKEKSEAIFNAFISVFSKEIKELGLILEYQGLNSPKYYNYRNDEIHIKITHSLGKEIDVSELLEQKIRDNDDEADLALYYDVEFYLDIDTDKLKKELEQ